MGSNEKCLDVEADCVRSIYVLLSINLIRFGHICRHNSLWVVAGAVDLKSMDDEQWHLAEHLVATCKVGEWVQ